MSAPLARVILTCGRQFLVVADIVLVKESDKCRDGDFAESEHPMRAASWTPELLEKAAAAINSASGAPPWSAEWPTEPGWYWFYGYGSEYESRTDRRRLIPTEVRSGAPGHVFYVANGTFLYQSEGASGRWLRMIVPALPGGEE